MMNIFILTVDYMTICMRKVSLRSFPQLYGAFERYLACCFGFVAHNFTVL